MPHAPAFARCGRVFRFAAALFALMAPALAGAEPESDPPSTSASAAALWRAKGRAALPRVAEFLRQSPWRGNGLQADFELLRDIATAVAPEEPEAAHVVAAVVEGLLRLEEEATVRLPGESFAAPWHVILRLAGGLRTRAELSPPLLRRIVSELATAEGGAVEIGPPAPFALSAPLRNGLYLLAYLREPEAIEPLLAAAKRVPGADRVWALRLLGQMRAPQAEELARAAFAESSSARDAAILGQALVDIAADAAEGPLLDLTRRSDPDFARAALRPLLSIATPDALAAVVAAAESKADPTLSRAVELQLGEFAAGIGTDLAALQQLIRADAPAASRLLRPLARRLELLEDGERRLRREELPAVLAAWRRAGTLAAKEWDWVRDRHVLAVAAPEDLRELELVRRAILSPYRPSCVNEAEIIQRMVTAIQRRHGLLTPRPQRP